MSTSKPMHTLLAALIAGCTLLAACGGGGADGGTPGTPPDNPTTPANPDLDPPTAAVGDEVVLKLFFATDLAAVQAAFGLTLIDQFGQRPIYRMRAASTGGDTEAFAETLQADPRIEFAEPNYLNQTPESRRRRIWAAGESASSFAVQWNSSALRLSSAHAISTGSNITVAVLDTGVDTSHPALAGRLVGGFDFVDFDSNASEEGSDPTNDLGYGHGTHVASLVAQVAPGARIMPVRVLDRAGEGNIWVLAEGLLHAIDPDGDPSTDDGAQVINASLGTTNESDLIEDILEIVTCDDDDDDDDAVRCELYGGSVVVGAAGNSGDTTRHYPAAEDEDGVIAVAASNQARALAELSTRGTWVHVSAPGEDIIGAVPGNRYAVWSGTSMAAPMVAGAAALLRSQQPSWSPERVARQLRDTAVPLCSGMPSQIDPAAALGAVPLTPTCPTPMQ